ncbi:MAG TPA: thiamine-phosphate kinase [Hyphomicrobium sp.]|nr:thiamine-phosphate kinase [Hyphomicrobium sp.]
MTQRITSETELIQTYLAPLSAAAPGALGLSDDAAYFTPPAGCDVVVTTDPIIAGVHFLAGGRADDIAWKALAVNVSDLAAKGATPLGYTMSLAFPEPPEHAWMAQFAQGLSGAQRAFGCALLGGDTDRTSGPLSIGVTLFGTVPSGAMVRRNGASVGDAVFVTGTLGDAALGLQLHLRPQLMDDVLTSGDKGFLCARYLRPAARVEIASLLRRHASGALDISDGLAKDLGRLAAGARARADVSFNHLPLSPPAQLAIAADPRWTQAVLAGGDDYEVLFSVPPEEKDALEADASSLPFNITHIGWLRQGSGVCVTTAAGNEMDLGAKGYDHFS